MNRKEIKKAIVSKIKEEYPNVPVYGSDVKEGYRKPSFFVSISTLFSERNTHTVHRICSAEIIYLQKEPDEEDAFQFFEKIEKLFSPKLVVGDRFFGTSEFSDGFLDEHKDVPFMEFDFEFFEKVKKPETSPLMGEVLWKGDV